MEKFIQNTLRRIREQNIKPEPRWKYLVRKYAVWFIFFFFALLCSVAVSAALYLSNELDWDVNEPERKSMIYFVLTILPYFWIVLALILLALAFFKIRRTEKGYRLSLTKIAAIILVSLLGFGIFSIYFDWGKKADRNAGKLLPFYRKTVTTKESQWSRPEQGFLSGTIINKDDNRIDLQDFAGSKWNIEINDKANIRPSVDLSAGEKIKVIGRKYSEKSFHANEIRPWEGKGMGGNGSGKRLKK